MDATTYAAMQLMQQRFAERDRENARRVARAERRAALGDQEPVPARTPGLVSRVLHRTHRGRREATEFVLAGPSS